MSAPTINPSVDEIRAIQKSHGLSWFEARREVERKELLKSIDRAETVDDLRAILYFLVRTVPLV